MCVIAMVFAVALPFASTSVSTADAEQELIERTLAIVSGEAVTLTDARTALALGLLDSARDIDAAAEALVRRTLMLREVQRYATPAPADAALEERVAAIRARLPPDEMSSVLAAGGFTERRLRTWVRDDLRIAAYVAQRFPPAATPEEDVRRSGLFADWQADLRRRSTVVELWKVKR